MTPVYQTQFYSEDPRVYGDCTRAVIASLLDLPVSEVPHFLEVADGKVGPYYDLIEEFLAARGLEMLWHHSLAYHWREGDPDVYHFMSGPSPRHPGVGHAVVGKNGQPFFDPHPDGTMLAGEPHQWKKSFLVRIK